MREANEQPQPEDLIENMEPIEIEAGSPDLLDSGNEGVQMENINEDAKPVEPQGDIKDSKSGEPSVIVPDARVYVALYPKSTSKEPKAKPKKSGSISYLCNT